jgi:hypothetical protein
MIDDCRIVDWAGRGCYRVLTGPKYLSSQHRPSDRQKVHKEASRHACARFERLIPVERDFPNEHVIGRNTPSPRPRSRREPEVSCQDRLAYTAPGSTVVFVCGHAVQREWTANRKQLVVTVIHEVLHTLRLGESASSPEIDRQVRKRCY